MVVPVYQSETAPRQIRGALVATYQLFVTMGILTSYCVNLGTSQVQDQSGSWRGAIAVMYLWSGILALGYSKLSSPYSSIECSSCRNLPVGFYPKDGKRTPSLLSVGSQAKRTATTVPSSKVNFKRSNYASSKPKLSAKPISGMPSIPTEKSFIAPCSDSRYKHFNS